MEAPPPSLGMQPEVQPCQTGSVQVVVQPAPETSPPPPSSEEGRSDGTPAGTEALAGAGQLAAQQAVATSYPPAAYGWDPYSCGYYSSPYAWPVSAAAEQLQLVAYPGEPGEGGEPRPALPAALCPTHTLGLQAGYPHPAYGFAGGLSAQPLPQHAGSQGGLAGGPAGEDLASLVWNMSRSAGGDQAAATPASQQPKKVKVFSDDKETNVKRGTEC